MPVIPDILTRAHDFLARRRATSDMEAVAVLVDLIDEVERLRERGAEQHVQHAVAAHIRHVRRLADDVDDIRAALQCAVDEDPEPEPVAARPRLVWVEAWPDWHLCRPDLLDWQVAPYSAWRHRAATYPHLGATVRRCVDVDNHAAAAALCETWARADGFAPDPWPGEVTP